jgi:hypothetical protein
LYSHYQGRQPELALAIGFLFANMDEYVDINWPLDKKHSQVETGWDSCLMHDQLLVFIHLSQFALCMWVFWDFRQLSLYCGLAVLVIDSLYFIVTQILCTFTCRGEPGFAW